MTFEIILYYKSRLIDSVLNLIQILILFINLKYLKISANRNTFKKSFKRIANRNTILIKSFS